LGSGRASSGLERLAHAMNNPRYTVRSHERSARILVVDDDTIVREVVVESLRLMGLEADVCGNGAEALAKNDSRPYDLIVTDMKLPGLDGLTLIGRLKSRQSETDVVVITGYGTIENAVECMKAGAIEYLIKPFTVDQIQVAVRKALEHRELRRRAQERELYMELSYVDSLTGVKNRRYLDEALDAEIATARAHRESFILLMIDIDDFKVYNDCNGHQKGDAALARVGQLLKSVCRRYDIVARYGGEEFAMIFPAADADKAMELAHRILNVVRQTRFEGEESLPGGALTVSAGVAVYPGHAENAEDLMACADKALYEAKRQGKNTARMASGLPPHAP
jgi:diguanylate cyclase (GGDEF)-like protein